MAAEAAEAAGDAEVTLYGCKCPLGGCPKKTAWLGVKGVWYTERRARQAVFDHLAGTSAHSALSLDDCAAEAELSEISEWKVSEQDEGMEEDLDKNRCSLAELREWQNAAVFFDDPQKRSTTKRQVAEPAGAPRKKPKQLNKSDIEARPRRSRSRSRGRNRRSRSRRSRDRDRRRDQPAPRALQNSQSSRASGSNRDVQLARSDRVQLTNLGDRLEDQITEQTRNAYIFVQVVFP